MDSLWWEQDAITGPSILARCTHRLTFLCLLPEVKIGFSFGDQEKQKDLRVNAKVLHLPENTQEVFLSFSCWGVPVEESPLTALPEAGWHLRSATSWQPIPEYLSPFCQAYTELRTFQTIQSLSFEPASSAGSCMAPLKSVFGTTIFSLTG